MGIDSFSSTIRKNKIFRNVEKDKNKNLTNGNKLDYIFFDFNSIIHENQHILITKLNEILYKDTKNFMTNPKLKIFKEKVLNEKLKNENKNIRNLDLDNISKLILITVLKFVNNLLIELVTDKTKLIYICIDGVPNHGKLIKQIVILI